ncbi:hypothetical protein ABE438_07205 [Bosea sp. TWI1241]|jgi:hypothetical protein
MQAEWGFLAWTILLAIPVGLMLAVVWSRSRPPGAARLSDEMQRDQIER